MAESEARPPRRRPELALDLSDFAPEVEAYAECGTDGFTPKQTRPEGKSHQGDDLLRRERKACVRKVRSVHVISLSLHLQFIFYRMHFRYSSQADTPRRTGATLTRSGAWMLK